MGETVSNFLNVSQTDILWATQNFDDHAELCGASGEQFNRASELMKTGFVRQRYDVYRGCVFKAQGYLAGLIVSYHIGKLLKTPIVGCGAIPRVYYPKY